MAEIDYDTLSPMASRFTREHVLRILHISDLARIPYQGTSQAPRQKQRWWQWWPRTSEISLSKAWHRNLDELAADGRRFDLLVCTGDIAIEGLTQDYDRSTRLLGEVTNRLKIPKERIFVVPGNRDIHRYTAREAWQEMRRMMNTAPEEVGAWLAAKERIPLGAQAKWRDAILTRQQAFWQWVKRDLGREALMPMYSPHRRLGYNLSIRLSWLPFPVHIIGLDSAWLSGDDADAGRLWLTEEQLTLLCRDKHGAPWPGFRLALMHHSLMHLADASSAMFHLDQTVDLLLHSHHHTPTKIPTSPPVHGTRILGTERQALNTYDITCQVIDARLTHLGRPLRYDIYRRRWSPDSVRWLDDIHYCLSPGRQYEEHELPALPRKRPAPSGQPLTAEPTTSADTDTISITHEVGVPTLPATYIQRATLQQAVVEGLSASGPATHTGPIVVVWGLMGIGKSVLAASVARSTWADKSFPDGIYWVTLGRNPNILTLQRQLARELRMRNTVFRWVSDGNWALRKWFAEKRALLILDDTWEQTHIEVFDISQTPSRLLITTRNPQVTHGFMAAHVKVDVLSLEESQQLLNSWLGYLTIGRTQLTMAGKLCGDLPLALAMVAANVCTGNASWETILSRLQHGDLTVIAHELSGYSYASVLESIDASMQALTAEARQVFLAFAVAPENHFIPVHIIEMLLENSGIQLTDAFRQLHNHGLIWRGRDGYSVHAILHMYTRCRQQNLSALHARLIDIYKARFGSASLRKPHGPYWFKWLPYHLGNAGRIDELRSLLKNYRWIKARWSDSPDSLIAAHELGPVDEELCLVRDALRLSLSVSPHHKTQLSFQLKGRLGHLAVELPHIRELLRQAQTDSPRPGLCFISASLMRAGGPLLRILRHHIRGELTALHALPGRDQVITASSDGSLYVWNLWSIGRPSHLFIHTDAAEAMVFLNASYLLFALRDSTLRCWELGTNIGLPALFGHADAVTTVALLASGTRALSGSWDRTLKLWDLASGKHLRTCIGHEDAVTAVQVFANDRRAISASWDHTLKIWDLDEGAELGTLAGHRNVVTAVAVFADGTRAISASWDHTLKVWDLERGVETQTLNGHRDAVLAVAVLFDGKRAISGSANGKLKVWDLESGKELRTLSGHEDPVIGVTVLDDNRTAVSASQRGTIHIWSLEAGALGQQYPGHSEKVSVVQMLDGGKRALSASRDGTLKLWDVGTGSEIATLSGHTDSIEALAIMDRGRKVVSASKDKTLKIWDLESGEALATLAGHCHAVKQVKLLSDGGRALSMSEDGAITLWDVEQGVQLHTFGGHAAYVDRIHLWDNDTKLLSASVDGMIRLWDVANGEAIRMLSGHSTRLIALSFLNDTEHLLSVCRDGILKVWDWRLGAELSGLCVRLKPISAFDVFENGKKALWAAHDATLRMWDVTRGGKFRTLYGHTAAIQKTKVLAAGTRAISLANDRTLRMWDLENGSELRTIKHGFANVPTFSLFPNDKELLLVSGRTIQIWNVDKGTLVARQELDASVAVYELPAIGNDTIVVGDAVGGVHFLQLTDPPHGLHK